MIEKSYSCTYILKDYLEEKLKLQKYKKSMAESGQKLSKIDIRQIKANDKKKVKVLDNHIFRSMANLVYFLEFLNNHKELEGVFERDVQELFGFKGLHMRYKSSDWRYLVLERFLEHILGFRRKYRFDEFDDKEQGKKEFGQLDVAEYIRLESIKTISRVLIPHIMGVVEEKDSNLSSIISEDLERLSVWVTYCTSDAISDIRTPHRKIGF